MSGDTGGNQSESSRDYGEEKQWRLYIHTTCVFVIGVLAVLGLVGNFMSFRTFGKMTPRKATTLLLRALAVLDSCVLLLTLTNYTATLALDFWNQIFWIFATRSYTIAFLHIAWMANIWTSVIIGLNRYIAVCQPLQAARLCTTSHARKQMLCVVLFSVMYGLPRFFRCKITKSPDGSRNICKPLLDDKVWYHYFYKIGCELIFRFSLPFVLLLFFCVQLATHLRAARKQSLGLCRGRRMDTRATSMLVTLLGLFLFCTTPNFIYNIVRNIPKHFNFTSPWLRIALHYVSDISDMLAAFSSSFNWVIYFAYMREFRQKQCGSCISDWGRHEDYEME